jgi:hypothetical protein
MGWITGALFSGIWREINPGFIPDIEPLIHKPGIMDTSPHIALFKIFSYVYINSQGI